MEIDFERMVEGSLRRARIVFVSQVAFRGFRPDFLVATRDKPVAVEAKASVTGREGAQRAIEVANRLRVAIDAGAALVVVPDGAELPEVEGIVKLSELAHALGTLGAQTYSTGSSESLKEFSSGLMSSQFASFLRQSSRDWNRSFASKTNIGVPTRQVSPRGAPAQLFVAMPFAGEFDDVYFVAAMSAAAQRSMVPIRIDQKYFSGEIPQKIRKELRRSAAVIADVSGGNPNVLYEVGFAHALRTPTIHISRTPLSELPFDVSRWNTIPYLAGQTHALGAKLDTALRALGI